MAFEKRKFLSAQRFHRMISDIRLGNEGYALHISRYQQDIAPNFGNMSFERESVFSSYGIP
jgi:hypothetical protein